MDEHKKYLGFPFYPNYWETYEILAKDNVERARAFLEAIIVYGTEGKRMEYKDPWIAALMPTIERSLDSNRAKNGKKYLKVVKMAEEEIVEKEFSLLSDIDVQTALLDDIFGNSN